MIEHVFSQEMMREREKQLMLALLDSAGVYYDVNYTRDRILGNPLQMVDGVTYPILETIGLEKGCTNTAVLQYWVNIMPENERADWLEFSRSDRVLARYAAGERVLRHKFWTEDVKGNVMLAEQTIRLYEDVATGDVLGLVYVSNGKDREALQRQMQRYEVWEALASDMPGGYHRCSTDNGFVLDFVSDSFLDIVGWTREEIRDELNNQFINIVAEEDRDFFMRHEEPLVRDGRIDVVYRVRRKSGEYRWVKDATVRATVGGQEVYQCTLADITDFVHQHEELTRQHLELSQKESLFELMERNMPAGYHRCEAKPGCPFIYISENFAAMLGYTREEIEGLGNRFENLMWPEDMDAMTTYEDMMRLKGRGNAYDTSVYRMRHKDGSYRWVSDSTMFVDVGEESFFQGSITDITEHIENLNEARRRAEASDQAKSVFLFNASHDIRTPMNAIQGFAHMIEENAEDPEIVRRTVKKISQAGKTLMTLMNDVLELARIEQGRDEINAQAVDLNEHGRNLYEMFAGEMEEAGIRFSMTGHMEHPHVMCDPLKLSRSGMNLLSNARKFTPAGGRVIFRAEELSCDGRNVTYLFETRDTGIGMSPEFQKRAFGQFERERTSTDSGMTGSGLGLAIIKRLVDLMGGTVEIRSELGRGTSVTATLTFPLVMAEEGEKPAMDPEEMDLSGRHILLVEDNDFNREITRYILEAMGIEVEDAENGAVAVDKVLRGGPGRYDAVLMDIQMPVMDGYTATKEIRAIADKAVASVPILAMTANAFDKDRQMCLEAGMNGHIAKPIERVSFLQELARVL